MPKGKGRYMMSLPNDGEINLFRITNLDSVSAEFDVFRIEPSSNFKFPHLLVNSNRSIELLLTNEELRYLMDEYCRYFCREDDTED